MFHALHPVTNHGLESSSRLRGVLVTNLVSGLWALVILVLWLVLLGAELFGVFYLALGFATFTAGLTLRLATQYSEKKELFFFLSLLITFGGLVALSHWHAADSLLTTLFGEAYFVTLLTLTTVVLIWQRTLAHFQSNSHVDLSLYAKCFLFPVVFSVAVALTVVFKPVSFDALVFLCILSIAASTWIILLIFGKPGPTAKLQSLSTTNSLYLLHGAWLLSTALVLAAYLGPSDVASFVIGAYGGLYIVMACNACAEHFRHSAWQASAQKGFPRIAQLITYSARVGFVVSLGFFLTMIVVAHRFVFPSLGESVGDAALIFTIFSTGSLAVATLGPAQTVLLYAGEQRLICKVYLMALALAITLQAILLPAWSGTSAALISMSLLYVVQFFLTYIVRRKHKVDTSILGWQPRGAEYRVTA